MKIFTFLLFSSFLFAGNALAQGTLNRVSPVAETQIPAAVMLSQQQGYPDALVTQWNLHEDAMAGGNKIYKATFDILGRPGISAFYLENGTHLFDAQFMAAEELPQSVRLPTQSAYDDYTIENGHLITLYAPERQFYQVRLRDQVNVLHLYYDLSGYRLNEQTLPPQLLFLQ